MKVIDLNLYRIRKEITTLEKRIGQLALEAEEGSARKLKTCFKEWLVKHSM